MSTAISDFMTQQAARERQQDLAYDKEREQAIEVLRSLMVEALGQEALDALAPTWEYARPHAQVWLHYEGGGDAFPLIDHVGLLVSDVQSRVSRWLVSEQKKAQDLADERARMLAVLQRRPLPNEVTTLWWAKHQALALGHLELEQAWRAVEDILTQRYEQAHAASREFALEVIADIENARDHDHIGELLDDIPSTIHADHVANIKLAAQVRLAELNAQQKALDEAKARRVKDLEQAAFFPFVYYEVYYWAGNMTDEDSGPPVPLLEYILSYNPTPGNDGWWAKTNGARVLLEHVVRVEERFVIRWQDWFHGLWTWATVDDFGGLRYRVPSPKATRLNIE